jgi:signal peptidase I
VELQVASLQEPARPTRGLAITSAVATIWVSAAIGSIVVRRWRRAAFWLVTELGWLALMLVAVITGHPRLMWAAMFVAAVGWRILAAIDAYRLARRARDIATWTTLAKAWASMMVAAVVLAAGVVRPFLVEAFNIPSKAMYPTLIVGDEIMVDKVHRTPHRGDVIVFKYPLDPTTDYVKRVVGLPGDVVEIKPGDVIEMGPAHLVVNGVEAPRERVQEDCPKGPDGVTASEENIPCVLWRETLGERTYEIGTGAALGEQGSFQRKVVPPGRVFVLGDNRDNSSDSRVWGTVPLEYVKGIVRFVWWSSGPAGTRWDRVDALVR